MASNGAFLIPSLFAVKGLVALVTGGGTGIGLMATQALAANGAKVYIVGRRQELLDNVVKKYGGANCAGEIIALPGDITKKSDITRLAAEIKKREGGLHLLSNNAGIAGPKSPILAEKDDKSLEELTAEMFKEEQSFWQSTWETNVESYYFMTLAFLPLLEAFTFGKDPIGKAIYEKYQTGVIFTSSISGLIKQAQNHFAYNAAKAGTIHLTRMFQTEFALKTGVRFNTIAPGVFPSEMTGEDADKNNKVSLEGNFDPKSMSVPANRGGTDEDMGGTVLYLASRAGQYTSGVIIPVDGGTLSTNPSTY